MSKTFIDILKSEDIKKFNPYHDRLGRFTTAGGAASFTYRPGASTAHDNAITREKVRTSSTDNDNKQNSGKMSALSEEAVEWYVSGDGMWINQALRGRGEISMSDLSDNEKMLLKGLDEATTQPIKEKTLYRAVDAEAVFGKMTEMQYYNLQQHLVYGDNQKIVAESALRVLQNAPKGKTITEKGFMSTTTNKDMANDWYAGSEKKIVLQLNVKSDVKGRDLRNHRLNDIMEQDEVLLARNQKYTVTGITAKDGEIYVMADM